MSDNLDSLAVSHEPEFEKALRAAIEAIRDALDMQALEASLNHADEADAITDHERDQLAIILGFDDDEFTPLKESIEASTFTDDLGSFFDAAAALAAAVVGFVLNTRAEPITAARRQAFGDFSREFLTSSSRAILNTARDMLAASGTAYSRMLQIRRVIGLTEAQATSLGIIRDAFQQYLNAPTKLVQDPATGRWSRVRNVNAAKIIYATRGRISGAQRRLLMKSLADEPTAAQAETILDRHATALRNHRINVVAGNLIHGFAESAKLAAWQYGQSLGHIDADQRRFWKTAGDERVRATHSAVPGLNPDGVPLDKPFKTPLGDFMTPPIEYGCRCKAVLGAAH